LVVDDNVDAAESLAMLMESWGHEVQIAHDGPTALQAAQRCYPDVIFLDIGLPGMNGYQVAKQLRQHPEFSKTLLIAITGYGQDKDRRDSKEAGFDHHLIKPVEPDGLKQFLMVVDSDSESTVIGS
jgi:two-component system CheB/CheR fusion protein